MKKLNFQDAFFLRAETKTCPFHVASLMVLTPPDDAPDDYLRNLAHDLGLIQEIWPVFGCRLENPASMRNPKWVTAEDYDPTDHVLHYQLSSPGRMQDLLNLVGHAHEQLLDRTRPLWQAHLIEGLPGGKFALYFKVHHALVDGVGGLRMIQEMFSVDPKAPLLTKPANSKAASAPVHNEQSIGHSIKHAFQSLLKQSKAVPEATSMFANFGMDFLRGKIDVPQLPFSAPRTILNRELDTRRRFIICDLPLKQVKAIGKKHGGTVNDVLVAVFGSALREYLLELGELPERSLDAGLPVSIKSADASEGNQLSFIICPFATDERDPVKRLLRVIHTTKKAKSGLAHISPQATEDLATMTMVPFLLLTLTHTSQRLPPVFNTIVSNVPGPKKTVYLSGSRLEKLYPLSIVTDGMGLNITVISYKDELCVGITCAPGTEPDIQSFGSHIERGFKELSNSIKESVAG